MLSRRREGYRVFPSGFSDFPEDNECRKGICCTRNIIRHIFPLIASFGLASQSAVKDPLPHFGHTSGEYGVK